MQFEQKVRGQKTGPWDMGIYPMAINQSEHDKFFWGRIKEMTLYVSIRIQIKQQRTGYSSVDVTGFNHVAWKATEYVRAGFNICEVSKHSKHGLNMLCKCHYVIASEIQTNLDREVTFPSGWLYLRGFDSI